MYNTNDKSKKSTRIWIDSSLKLNIGVSMIDELPCMAA